MTSEETIRDIYRATGSIRAAARETGHSWQTVRKVLLQYGDYTNDRAGQIREMSERGMAPETIAAALKIGKRPSSPISPTPARPTSAWKRRTTHGGSPPGGDREPAEGEIT